MDLTLYTTDATSIFPVLVFFWTLQAEAPNRRTLCSESKGRDAKPADLKPMTDRSQNEARDCTGP